MTPLISVVIPTRSRAGTLAATLAGLAEVARDDVEFVVADNASTDATAAITAAHVDADARFRHCRSDRDLVAADNFERAIDLATGQWLMFIGDDDAVFPRGLDLVAGLIAMYEPEVVNWTPAGWIWGDGPSAAFLLHGREWLQGPWVETSADGWSRVLSVALAHHFTLTGFNIYHGCVRRDVIARARAGDGRLFDGAIADVAASYRLMDAAPERLMTGHPVTIAANSSASIGQAFATARPTAEQLRVRAEFAIETAKRFPDREPLGDVPAMLTPYLATLADHLRRRDGGLGQLDPEPWRDAMLDELAHHPGDGADAARAAFDRFLTQLGAAPIAPTEVIARRAGGLPLPRHPWSTFHITPDAARRAAAIARTDARRVPDGLAGYRLAVTEAGVLARCWTDGRAVTVADVARLGDHLHGLGDAEHPWLYLADPELARACQRVALAADVAREPDLG